MKKNMCCFSRFFLFSLCLFSTMKMNAVLNYEVYLESWNIGNGSPPNWQTSMQGLPAGPGGNSSSTYQGVTLNISFGAYLFPGLNGLQFLNGNTDVATVINYVHSQGGKVKVSFGGASYAPPFYPNYFISQTTSDEGWPNNIPQLAAGVAAVINTNFGTNQDPLFFDGVDFDIEDPLPSTVNGQPYTSQDFANDLMTFLTAVRSNLPGKIISIAIPAQGWNSYWEFLAKQSTVAGGPIDYINFMEYDIYVTPGISLAQQIGADLLTYTSAPTQVLPPNWAPGWGIDPSKIQMGLMPGNDDVGNILTVAAAADLASLAVVNSYGKELFGVMIWDIDRDALTDPLPLPTTLVPPPYQYSIAIREALASPTPLLKGHVIKNKRLKRRLVPFIRQPVPPHGDPS